PLGQGREDGVELGGIDLVEQADQVLEHRVDLGADIFGLQYGARRQTVRTGVVRIDQLDVLRTEDGGGLNAGSDVGRNELDLIRKQVQLHTDWGPSAGDGADLADLHAPHLDLGTDLHHQPGPIGDQGHRDEGGEGLVERAH